MATILRSSKYVRNFTEFATKLGFSHSKADVRVSLLSQRHSAPSIFTKSLATQVAAKQVDNESNLEITLRRLDAHVKRYGIISRNKLERILNAFQTAQSVTSSQALMVIRCCGNLVPDELPESRSKLVNQVWKSLENSGIKLDLSHYNALLRVYVENEYAFSPAEILAELERRGIEPNKLTYQRLISRYCQQGDIEGASKILEYMREKEISVNEDIFTALVRGHSEANDMVSAADILSVMRQTGLEPSADTYKELLCGYAKHGDIESITRTLSECASKNVHLLDTDFLHVIFSLACNGHAAHVDAILSIMPKEVGYIQDALTQILKLVHVGQLDVAMQVLFSIPNRDKGQTGSSVIKQLATADLPLAKFLDLCKQIKSKGINSRALPIALEANLLAGNVEGSLAFLQALAESNEEIREHYFWPVFIELGRRQDDAGINDLVRAMKIEYRLFISEETLRDYVIPNKTSDPHQTITDLYLSGISPRAIAYMIIQNLVTKMKLKEAADFALQHDIYYNTALFCRPLVTALANTRDVTSFVQILLHIYQNRFNARAIKNQEDGVDNKNLEPYIIDIATFIQEDKSAILTEVLKELLASGYRTSNSCATTLQQILGNQLTPELARLLKFRNSSSVSSSAMDLMACREEISRLEGLGDKLTSNEQSAISTQKRLLYLYSRVKDFPSIERTVAALNEYRVEFTDTMYRQLFNAYIDSDVLNKTEEYLTNLREIDSAYMLDDAKLTKYIVLLLKNDRIDDAVQFLQQNLIVRNSSNNKYVQWRLLNSVAELGMPKALNAIFDMLLANEYIEISNLNLGPLVKVHIVRDDLTEALSVFEKICETYRHTPLKNELAKKFIQAENVTALQRLTDLSTEVHGETNSLYDLAQSFIESDCLRQARKILEIPDLQQKFNKLKVISKWYREQGKTIYLERLISVIKDVPHFKAIPEFYNDLLYCYVDENNWEKGLSLKKRMEEEEIEPSDVFLVTLADLLKRCNQPVTFTVPEFEGDTNIRTHKEFQLPKPASISSKRQQPVRGTDDGSKNSNTDPLKSNLNRTKKEIELLLQSGKLHAAFEVTETLLQKNEYPYSRTFKYMVRQASRAGEIELLEKLGKNLPRPMKKLVNFNNSLCQAYAVARRTAEYLDMLEKDLEAVDESDLNTVIAEFPMVGVRFIFENQPEFVERYTQIAENYAARGMIQPINALWVYYFITGKQEEADKIWSEHLIKSSRPSIGSIFRFAQRNKNEELVRRLIKILDAAPLVDDATKGSAYSELIKLCYLSGNYQESVNVLREALKAVSVDNLQHDTIRQMKWYLAVQGLALPANILLKSQATEAREQLTT